MRLIISLLWQQAKRYPWTYSFLVALILMVATVWVLDPLWTSYAIDQLLKAKDGTAVDYGFIFTIWGLLFLSHAILQSLNKLISWKLNNHMILDRREEVFSHVLELGISFHTKQKSGEVVKILDEGADTLVDLQRILLIQLIPSFLTAFAFLYFAFRISPVMAGVILVGLFLYVSIALMGTQKTRKLQHEVNALWVAAIGRALDSVTNIYSVKSGAQEKREMAVMHATHEETYWRQQRVNYRWAAVEGVNFFFLTRILVISLGIYLYTKNAITLGEVFFFQSSFYRVLTPFEQLGDLLPQWNKLVGKVQLAQQILQTPIEVRNSEHPIVLPELQGEIAFHDVCFSYRSEPVLGGKPDEKITEIHSDSRDQGNEELEDSPRILPVSDENGTIAHDPDEQVIRSPDAEDRHDGEVLHSVDLVIQPGEHIAFVGHSGAGKTTLAMLISRFYDMTTGRITIDGRDVRELDMYWWRAQIGLVLQENIMFNDSILENIRYARPDATLEEVREAARRAAADEFIEQLPGKYETLIGDRGIRLSGGQRQRVAIARAILKRPKIVVLDEATSALDSVTEKHVQEGIKSLIEGRTSCIIAHRLSTVRSVDRIAVFDKGQLIDVAPHEILLKRCAIYREMVELQSQGMLAEA